MVRRSQPITPPQAGAPRAETALVSATFQEDGIDEHLIVFRIADDSFGFRLGDVGEIVRLPALSHMPFGPKSLLGLANLRGQVIAAVDIRHLLGFPAAPPDEAARMIVIDRGQPVAFLVDRIESLLTLSADRVEKDDAGAGAVDPDILDGVVKGAEGNGTIKILSPQRLLRNEFARLGVSGSRGANRVSISA